MSMTRAFVLALAVAGCAYQPAAPLHDSFDASLQALEASSGGRLGVALVDENGRILGGTRSQERFAFCSTFKLLLAGMILDGNRRGQWSLDERLPLLPADVTFHSPVTERLVQRGWISMRDAAEAIVTVSDNAAANLLLKRTGGVDAFNGWLAARGDTMTRLDRLEPSLNENAAGDARDTTTPDQMARNAAGLVFGDWLEAGERKILREWLVASETGLDRLRAGLPPGWMAGDKTGTCGGKGTSYNDVAFIIPPGQSERGYAMAVYLDRPAVQAREASRVLAETGRSATLLMRR